MLCNWNRRERLSVIAGLTLSPRRRRVGLYFAIHRRNVRTDEVEAFVREAQRRLNRPLVVVWDRLAAHKSAAKRLASDERFQFEWLPAYAPDLNPAEWLWSHTKYGDLANFVPDDAQGLEIEAGYSLWKTRRKQTLLRSFFQGAGLKI